MNKELINSFEKSVFTRGPLVSKFRSVCLRVLLNEYSRIICGIIYNSFDLNFYNNISHLSTIFVTFYFPSNNFHSRHVRVMKDLLPVLCIRVTNCGNEDAL